MIPPQARLGAGAVSLLVGSLTLVACDTGNVGESASERSRDSITLDAAVTDTHAADVELDRSRTASEIAVIVDSPYGDAALARFPELIDSIDAAEGIGLVVHVGDIKAGDAPCSDEWYEEVRRLFMSFDDPLIYSPGDNEWTDCHRNSNGAYEPLERLDTLRSFFFASPGTTLGGQGKRVHAQSGHPENQLWLGSGVVFATVHQVGSNNGFSPWHSGQETPEQRAARLAAFERRDAANVAWLGEAFALAEREDAAGVALFLHADMWSPVGRLDGGNMEGHRSVVATLAAAAERFDRPVLMLSGDSHDYRVDAPVEWFELYGIASPENLTQIILDRSVEEDIVWLRLSIDPDDSMVFRWEQVVTP